MIGSIPSYHDLAKEKKQVLGRCVDCGYVGPMEHGLTGYECSRCRSMRLWLKLVDGRYWAQFTEIIRELPEPEAQGATAGEQAQPEAEKTTE